MMFEARSTFTIDNEEIQNPTSLAFILQTTLVNLEFFMPSQVERLANDLLFTCLKVIDWNYVASSSSSWSSSIATWFS